MSVKRSALSVERSGSKSSLVCSACADFPDTPSKTLARKLYAEHAQLWPTLDACYQAIRTARGNHGNAPRHRPAVVARRPNQPAGFKWVFPKSSAEPWETFPLESPRTLVLSDLHIPFHDSPAIHACVREGRRFLRPGDTILLNGDVCDFFSISRFDKNPSKSSLKKEIDLTRQFLGWLRQQFPRCRIVYKFGNHDEWFAKYLWRKAPELWGIPQMELPHLLTSSAPSATSCENKTPEIEGIEFLTDQQRITAGHLAQVQVFDADTSSTWLSATGVPPNAIAYSAFNYTFTALGSEARLRFTDISGNNPFSDLWLDNVAVSAIPEPATTAAVLGIAAVGLVGWRRRRATPASHRSRGGV